VDSGLYAACTAWIARTQSLDIAANNLANVDTNGYRAQRATFRSVLAESSGAKLSPLNEAINDYAVLQGTRVDTSSGTLERTANDLDFAVEGSGYFVVQTKAGLRYTRNRHFQISAEGRLVTASGDAVLGEEGPLQIPRGALSVGPDGTLSVAGALAGKLRIVDFAPGTPLQSEGSAYHAAPQGTARAASGAVVRQGMLESSNVSPVEGAIGLITLQRHAELLQRAVSVFHSEFNRIAAEDLPRIS
jgi:flagellar basal-body rod protein FlgF/flagellar basal-body rod protein FlgG